MNFKEYIEKDIEEKKALLDLLPMNTEARVKKYKDTITDIIKNYEPTIENTRKYIDYKYKKLYPVTTDRNEMINNYQQSIDAFKKMLVVTNDYASFLERSELDVLILELEHYYNHSLQENNDNIIKIIEKFKQAGIPLTENDFKLNVFSYNYMIYLFQMIKGQQVNIEILKKLFWKCPNLYENIIISIRMHIENNEKKFNNFIKDYETKMLRANKFSSKSDLINKIYELEVQKEKIEEKDEPDMILDFMNDELDFGVYKDTFSNLYGELDYFLINEIDTTNPELLNKTVATITNFHDNLLEYGTYRSNEALFENIKNLYTKNIEPLDQKQLAKDIKNQQSTIKKLYTKAKKLFVNKALNIANIEQSFSTKEVNDYIEQQKILNELYTELGKSDSLYFNKILKNKINNNSFISDIINIIISYPYFSKSIIKSVFEYETDEDVEKKYNELFDLFYNRKRKLIDMKSVFSTENFERRLMDAYRFDNLNVNETTFEEDNQNLIFTNYEKLKNKLKISHFTHTLDEIEFLINIKKMYDEEQTSE